MSPSGTASMHSFFMYRSNLARFSPSSDAPIDHVSANTKMFSASDFSSG